VDPNPNDRGDVTNEQKKAKVAALLTERRGYENRGLSDRVAQVDEELRRLGASAKAPAKRAERR
jgi:hypothetical protein